MSKESIGICIGLASALASWLVVPETRMWSCAHYDYLCKEESSPSTLRPGLIEAPATPMPTPADVPANQPAPVEAPVASTARGRASELTSTPLPSSPLKADPYAPWFRSLPSTQPTSIRFVNRLNETIGVFWKNFAGREQLYMTLAPGQEYEQQTFLTHAWIVRKEASAAIVFALQATQTPETAIVAEP